MKQKLLFICSSNIDRSPAAEELINTGYSDKFEAKSCGVGPTCDDEKRVSKKLVDWADTIFVMDERNQEHKTLLLDQVPEAVNKKIIILEISNDYLRYDPVLKEILRNKIISHLDHNILGL